VKRLLLLAAPAMLCIWALVTFAYRPMKCNRALADLQGRTNLASETGDTYRATLLARQNLTELLRLEKCCRTIVNLYVLEANNSDVLGRKEDAVVALRRALTVDQRPEIYFNIGTLLVELGRMDEAVDNYVTAARTTATREISIPSPEAAERVRARVSQLAGSRRK
jgi:tetratricopeptide (TPR) repeat protein